MSQLVLALEANVSQRHLSFVESGRARPSREMVLQLARSLDVPLRERNSMLLAAGYAPIHPQRPLHELGAAREAIDGILAAHDPYPALAHDRYFDMVAANRGIALLVEGVADPALLNPPANVLRLSLHPDGLAPRIRNLADWREHLLRRLENDLARSGDTRLKALWEELLALPAPEAAGSADTEAALADLAVPIELVVGDVLLRFISTTTVFGTPTDVTLSEIALESFFPADAATTEALHDLQGRGQATAAGRPPPETA